MICLVYPDVHDFRHDQLFCLDRKIFRPDVELDLHLKPDQLPGEIFRMTVFYNGSQCCDGMEL